jgi:hypothetical protein
MLDGGRMAMWKGSVLASGLLVVGTALAGPARPSFRAAASAGSGCAEPTPLDSVAPKESAPSAPDRGPSERGRAQTPRVQLGPILATSGVPVEVLRRILRQNLGRFRACYEKGLERHPNLEGQVKLHFVIESDGSTSNARDDGSRLPDASVVRCMAKAVERLSFPKPQGQWAPLRGKTMNVLVHFSLSRG